MLAFKSQKERELAKTIEKAANAVGGSSEYSGS